MGQEKVGGCKPYVFGMLNIAELHRQTPLFTQRYGWRESRAIAPLYPPKSMSIIYVFLPKYVRLVCNMLTVQPRQIFSLTPQLRENHITSFKVRSKISVKRSGASLLAAEIHGLQELLASRINTHG